MRCHSSAAGLVLAFAASATTALSAPLTTGAMNINGPLCPSCVSTSSSPTSSTTAGVYGDGGHSALLTCDATAAGGKVQTSATASYDIGTDGDWNSVFWNAYAYGEASEVVLPDWAAFVLRYNLPDAATVVSDVTIGISGETNATATGTATPGAQAAITYHYDIADAHGSGSMNRTNSSYSETGSWAPVTTQFSIHRTDVGYSVNLRADAFAMAVKGYQPFGQASALAQANFSHTLKWLGVSHIRAFDAAGTELTLPVDAYIDMIGQDTGFNYRNSVDAPTGIATPPVGQLSIALTAAPNPCVGAAMLQMRLPAGSAPVTLRVFDTRGRVVRTLLDRTPVSGSRAAFWDGRTDTGVDAPSGIYTAQVDAGSLRGSTRIVLAR